MHEHAVDITQVTWLGWSALLRAVLRCYRALACAVAPPQCSMKEPLPGLAITLEYDGMDATCTTSTESTPLLHLHAWHTLRAPTSCGAQTDAAAQLEQLAQRNQRCDAGMHTFRGRARVMGLVVWATGPCVRRCIRESRYFRPYPGW